MVKSAGLLKRLRNLGFSLFETEDIQNANLTLADVIKSRDLRLWEGFPVILANAAEKDLLDLDRVRRYLKKPSDKICLDFLIGMSLALYNALDLKFSWTDKLFKSLNKESLKKYKDFVNLLKNNSNLAVDGYEMSAQRLKNTFSNYFTGSYSGFSNLLSSREELGLEYALSQIFSPKQKELFLKKLKGEKLTKTEKEYFSRTVKKRVLALANPELHRLSQKLSE